MPHPGMGLGIPSLTSLPKITSISSKRLITSICRNVVFLTSMLHWHLNLLFTVLSFNLHTSTTRNIHIFLSLPKDDEVSCEVRPRGHPSGV